MTDNADHDEVLSKDDEDAHCRKRGKIVITIERGSKLAEEPRDCESDRDVLASMTMSKKVVVDKAKSHSLK